MDWSFVRCPVLVVLGQTGIMSAERAYQLLARGPTALGASIPLLAVTGDWNPP